MRWEKARTIPWLLQFEQLEGEFLQDRIRCFTQKHACGWEYWRQGMGKYHDLNWKKYNGVFNSSFRERKRENTKYVRDPPWPSLEAFSLKKVWHSWSICCGYPGNVFGVQIDMWEWIIGTQHQAAREWGGIKKVWEIIPCEKRKKKMWCPRIEIEGMLWDSYFSELGRSLTLQMKIWVEFPRCAYKLFTVLCVCNLSKG